jgi:DNA-3-methyladenine glycosylase I
VSGLVVGADGRARCGWAGSAPEYLAYHDEEWGRPVHGDAALYERLTLEAFQSGLAWITILRKREGFRRAFAGFDPRAVAQFDDGDVARLLADTGIVRNRAKIVAAITNARATEALVEADGPGALDRLVWSAVTEPATRPRSLTDVPASTPESKMLARELKRRGFAFVGPTTVYATMQACGVVDDHLAGCWVREAVGDELSSPAIR